MNAETVRGYGWRILLVGLFVAVAGCSGQKPADTITLATTTSTEDSGLLDVLVPMFREETGIAVKVVAVGTGQALALGRRGDADVLLVHHPPSEKQFVKEGFGIGRQQVMHNDFVLVGPETDPAGIRGEKDIARAFAKIAEKKATFISRGDESGTHQKEKAIWERVEIKPSGEWYVSAGSGMGAVLRMADEKRAYTLTDRGTFLALRDKLKLEVLSEGDPLLFNPYSVILVNPEKHPHVHHEAARKFADFLLSPQAQKAIGEFRGKQSGRPLFIPERPAGGE